MAENGKFELYKDGFRVRCGFGWLYAHPTGDPGIYDDVSIDLVNDDGDLLQVCTVTCYEGEGDPRWPAELKTLAWGGIDECAVTEQEVTVNDNSYWYVKEVE